MKSKVKEVRENLVAMQRMHESLGDEYLALCAASDVEPLPVLWSTCPPKPDGVTQAYVLFGYDEETDEDGQIGVDIQADTRAELVHSVFLKVLALRCVN